MAGEWPTVQNGRLPEWQRTEQDKHLKRILDAEKGCPACGEPWDRCSCPVEEMEPEEE